MKNKKQPGRRDIAASKVRSHQSGKNPRSDVAAIVEVEHEKYRILAGRLGGEYVARAFPKATSRARGLIAETQGESEEAAVAALMEVIKARDVRREAKRRWDASLNFSVPNPAEFTEALYQTNLTEAQITILKSLAWTIDPGMTFAQLANASGRKQDTTAERLFVRTGELVADYLRIIIGTGEPGSPETPHTVLAKRLPQNGDKADLWGLHPELRDAARRVL